VYGWEGWPEQKRSEGPLSIGVHIKTLVCIEWNGCPLPSNSSIRAALVLLCLPQIACADQRKEKEVSSLSCFRAATIRGKKTCLKKMETGMFGTQEYHRNCVAILQ